jgi:hypothetical protein
MEGIFFEQQISGKITNQKAAIVLFDCGVDMPSGAHPLQYCIILHCGVVLCRMVDHRRHGQWSS